MDLQELSTYITETLGIEAVTLQSLVVCTNNCFADLHTRGYRQFNEVELTENLGSFPIVVPVSSIEDKIEGKFRSMEYLKVADSTGRVVTVPRINLTSENYKAVVDINGNYRVDFNGMPNRYVYYIVNDKIVIDTAYLDKECVSVIIGFQETLTRLPIDSALTATISMREDLVTAVVLYGEYFYSKRSRLDAELSKEDLNRYRYFVEDMLSNLSKEDSFYAVNEVGVDDIYE